MNAILFSWQSWPCL